MMLPSDDAEVLAWSSPRRSKLYYGGLDEGVQILLEVGREVEAAFYPESKCLGIQWHPEIMDENSDGYRFFMELLERCR